MLIAVQPTVVHRCSFRTLTRLSMYVMLYTNDGARFFFTISFGGADSTVLQVVLHQSVYPTAGKVYITNIHKKGPTEIFNMHEQRFVKL